MKTAFTTLLVISVLALLTATSGLAATISDGWFYYHDNSIASGKSGLGPNSNASSSNFTNNTLGITGVKLSFELSVNENINNLIIDHFDFHFGNSDNAGNWSQLSLENAILGINGNEATIKWDNPIVKDGWLEVEYLTNQYLYFGNLVGDASLDGVLNPIDALEVIDHLNSGSQIYSYQYDINGDGYNSPADALTIINRLNSGYTGFSIADGPFVHTTGLPPQFFIPRDPVSIYDITFSDGIYALTSTPVPEPSTILLFGAGLLGLAGCSRKKLKNR